MPRHPIRNAQVKAAFDRFPAALRGDLLRLRELILDTAPSPLIETLKWGQPAYLPQAPRIGTTVRIDAVKGDPDRYAIYFHCQTTLVADFRQRYAELFAFAGNRALLLRRGEPLPAAALRHCIATALTYHAARRRR